MCSYFFLHLLNKLRLKNETINKTMMRKYYFLFLALAVSFFMVSCSGKYDGAISSYIESTEGQTSKIEVKVNEAKELKKVTVGDSINFLNMKAEKELKARIEQAEKELASYQQDLVRIGTSSKVVTDAYTVQLTKTQQIIDSLKAVKPEPTRLYEGQKTDQVLAVVVECKYTVTNEAKEKTDVVKNFVLSTDGKTCYGVTDNPDMSAEK
ncbi:hypothetical protein IR148_00975 [Dysgonomonas mossii]|uniref:Uncharacterized protein n=2 Tax=Dysgonomonas mossii TaxID=163665 RepID=A0A4Y9IPX5_9BACT|nr:hypothetical protein [Dysgonomonas mossii]TFU90580.1 hypothetical protein E4T88_00970 [Dysgonomonas mossii]